MIKQFDIATAFKNALINGAEHIPNALSRSIIEVISYELELVIFSEQNSTSASGVRQRFHSAAFRRSVPKTFPHILQLQQETKKLVRSASPQFPKLKTWQPHDAVIQKYTSYDFITAHLDLKRHPYIIVIYNIVGSCMFEILSDRGGHIVKEFRPESGDLVLLRAPGLSGNLNIDDRPFHRVGGNLSRCPYRISITFRENLEPNKAVPGLKFVYGN